MRARGAATQSHSMQSADLPALRPAEPAEAFGLISQTQLVCVRPRGRNEPIGDEISVPRSWYDCHRRVTVCGGFAAGRYG